MGATLNTRAVNYAKRQIGKRAWLLDPGERITADDIEALGLGHNYCLGTDEERGNVYPFVKLDTDGHVRICRSALDRIALFPTVPDEIRAAAEELLRRIDADPLAVPGPLRRAYTGPLDERHDGEGSTAEFEVEDIELRQAGEDDLPRLVGYAAVFEVLSREMWFGREKIAKGAFARSIRERADVIATIEHQGGLNVIGRTAAGTLSLREDDKGLWVEIETPDTQAGRDVVELVERGDLRQMSFMFRIVRQEIDDSGDEPVRTLLDVDLFDVSIVAIPAYRETSVETDADDLEGAESRTEDHDQADDPTDGQDEERSRIAAEVKQFGERVEAIAAGIT